MSQNTKGKIYNLEGVLRVRKKGTKDNFFNLMATGNIAITANIGEQKQVPTERYETDPYSDKKVKISCQISKFRDIMYLSLLLGAERVNHVGGTYAMNEVIPIGKDKLIFLPYITAKNSDGTYKDITNLSIKKGADPLVNTDYTVEHTEEGCFLITITAPTVVAGDDLTITGEVEIRPSERLVVNTLMQEDKQFDTEIVAYANKGDPVMVYKISPCTITSDIVMNIGLLKDHDAPIDLTLEMAESGVFLIDFLK